MLETSLSHRESEFSWRKTCSYLGHILFFGGFFLISNPFIFIESALRFFVFALMLSLGVVLININEEKKRRVSFFPAYCTILFLAVSAARLNYVRSATHASVEYQIFLPVMTVFSIICSLLITNKFSIRLASFSIFASGLLCFVPIMLNYRDLFDRDMAETYTLGMLSFNSYQTVAQIIGMLILNAIFIFWNMKLKIHAWIIFVPIIFAALFVTMQGYARGEAAALVLSAVIFVFGSRSFIVFGILALSLSNIVAYFIDSPLAVRILSLINGDFAERDYLLQLSINTIYQNPSLILIGGGMNYFQIDNSLPFELYPHNIFIEGLISGGIFLLVPMSIIYLLPIIKAFIRNVGESDQRYLLSMTSFFAIIYMKSGTLLSFWGLGVLTCMFLALNGAKELRQGAR